MNIRTLLQARVRTFEASRRGFRMMSLPCHGVTGRGGRTGAGYSSSTRMLPYAPPIIVSSVIYIYYMQRNNHEMGDRKGKVGVTSIPRSLSFSLPSPIDM